MRSEFHTSRFCYESYYCVRINRRSIIYSLLYCNSVYECCILLIEGKKETIKKYSHMFCALLCRLICIFALDIISLMGREIME